MSFDKKKESMIDDLYYQYINGSEYADEYFKKIKIVDNAFCEKYIRPLYESKADCRFDMEDLYTQSLAESEQFGFMIGFKYAMKLWAECI